jgi:XTP/dITP diphosphohydrolase
MNKIIFATNNKHKLEEIRQILHSHYQVVSLAELGCFDDIPETADTLEGNSCLKASYISTRYSVDCFADDTGLEVDALGGRPGVFSARYAGEEQNPEANIQKLLYEMEGIKDRAARFRTVIAAIIERKEYYFEGIVEGRLTTERFGSAGFGYDPIFIPDGYSITFAQMPLSDKNAISHRARAMTKLVDFLKAKESF